MRRNYLGSDLPTKTNLVDISILFVIDVEVKFARSAAHHTKELGQDNDLFAREVVLLDRLSEDDL